MSVTSDLSIIRYPSIQPVHHEIASICEVKKQRNELVKLHQITRIILCRRQLVRHKIRALGKQEPTVSRLPTVCRADSLVLGSLTRTY
ncbi:MAG: hypothetical protein H6Q14_185 [Bacteroidetes bacterium]|nr:hypothetical protein [Bacteroidota bacterium]